MEAEELVSIILPIYNAEKWLTDTLTSVIGQTYSNWECILINDGSTDRSADIVQEFIDRFPEARFRLLSTINRGVSSARNSGLQAAAGNYIALLDSDDVWTSKKLQIQTDTLRSNPSAGGVICGFFISATRPDGSRKKSRLITHDNLVTLTRSWLSLEGNGALPSSTLLYRRVGELKDLRFETALSTAADLDFFLRMEAITKIVGTHEALVEYRQHGNQMHLDPAKLKLEIQYLLDHSVHPLSAEYIRLVEANSFVMASLLNIRAKHLRESLKDLFSALKLRPISLITLPYFILRKRFMGLYKLTFESTHKEI